jgi:hypothetical protein
MLKIVEHYLELSLCAALKNIMEPVESVDPSVSNYSIATNILHRLQSKPLPDSLLHPQLTPQLTSALLQLSVHLHSPLLHHALKIATELHSLKERLIDGISKMQFIVRKKEIKKLKSIDAQAEQLEKFQVKLQEHLPQVEEILTAWIKMCSQGHPRFFWLFFFWF